MKRFLSLIILPIFAIIFFYGCGEDKTIDDMKNLYASMITVTPIDELDEDNNLFFSNTDNPKTISIEYPEIINVSINNQFPSSDMQYRYRGLYYQQQILNYIFNFYENHESDFYTKLFSSSANYKNDLNNLYTKLSDLKSTLEDFKSDYKVFVDSFSTTTMRFNVVNYSYRLNWVIDKSFDFIYQFKDMYLRYCVEDINLNTLDNVKLLIDLTYIDIANIVYMENIKSFNYSVGANGECDLASLFYSSADNYRLIDKLTSIKDISIVVQNGLIVDNPNHDVTNDLIDNFRYAKDLFDQKKIIYDSVYNELDFYTINLYRCGLVNGVNYDTYLNTMTISERSLVEFNQEFIKTTFENYVSKLNTIIL